MFPAIPITPAVATEVLQEVIAETQVEAVEVPTETHDDEPGADFDSVSEADANGAAAVTADGDAPVVVKRKTRRGSRGGRDRRKKPAGAATGLAGVRQSPRSAATAVSSRWSRATGPQRTASPVIRRAHPGPRRSPSPKPTPAVEPSTAESGSWLRADVGVARRFRPQMTPAFRYTPSACGRVPAFSAPERRPSMSYAIISLGGKQYRVSEGQRLLVDRLATEDGKTFTPDVLLVGGDGAASLSPKDVTVTVKVVGQQRGPKIRIGKYN